MPFGRSITVKSGSHDILVEDLYCEHGDGLTIGSIWLLSLPSSSSPALAADPTAKTRPSNSVIAT